MASALMEIRLSHETDEPISPERQQRQARGYCERREWTIVPVAMDLDVSGAISPFERSKLSPWLTMPELVAKWDVLVVAALDRLSCSLLDVADLLEWCTEHTPSRPGSRRLWRLATPAPARPVLSGWITASPGAGWACGSPSAKTWPPRG